jgi:hypothetical protein
LWERKNYNHPTKRTKGADTIFVNFTSLTFQPIGAYFDDLALTQVPEPSSLWMLGLVRGLDFGPRRQRA